MNQGGKGLVVFLNIEQTSRKVKWEWDTICMRMNLIKMWLYVNVNFDIIVKYDEAG
jgi:hypothetical protein